ncbi:MAG: phosphate ABC transporter permease subunit PstC [Acidimicrobiia bacterium]
MAVATTPVDFRGRRAFADRGFGWLVKAAGVTVLLVLGLIALTMGNRSRGALSAEGLDFFTSKRWAPSQGHFGALAFIYGTVVTAIIALVLAVPVSVGIALFTTEIAPPKAKRFLVYTIDLLAVVPSVVFGLWGLLLFSGQVKGFYDTVHDLASHVPVLSGVFGIPNGTSLFTAGTILAVMITPIISSLAREVISTCPQADREGALALGATKWEMIKGAVLPHSRQGLVGASMLGLGRAMGETIAAALVIGSSPQITQNLFGSGYSMPAVIPNEWGEAEGTWRSALILLAVTLFVMTVVVNMLAQTVVTRSNKKRMGTH